MFRVLRKLQSIQPKQCPVFFKRTYVHRSRSLLWPKYTKDNSIGDRCVLKTSALCCQNTKQANKPVQFYAKHGASCVFFSGVAVWSLFFPATQALSYFGGAEYFIDWLSSYHYGAKFVEAANSASSGTVQLINRYISDQYITQQGIERFVLGFVVYFCLKPVRYPLWAYITRVCIKRKQMSGVINQKLMKEHGAETRRRVTQRVKRIGANRKIVSRQVQLAHKKIKNNYQGRNTRRRKGSNSPNGTKE